jgi:hypothetical protein
MLLLDVRSISFRAYLSVFPIANDYRIYDNGSKRPYRDVFGLQVFL